MTNNLPKFKYHPNVYSNDIVSHEHGICECCGKSTDVFISQMYAREDITCICPYCVANGSAAKKFDGDFIDWFEAGVTDPAKKDELLHRTPGYSSWQGERWMTHCEDFCAYIGEVDATDLQKIDNLEDIINETEDAIGVTIDINEFIKGGSPTCHMFRCLHCGKIRLDVEFD